MDAYHNAKPEDIQRLKDSGLPVGWHLVDGKEELFVEHLGRQCSVEVTKVTDILEGKRVSLGFDVVNKKPRYI